MINSLEKNSLGYLSLNTSFSNRIIRFSNLLFFNLASVTNAKEATANITVIKTIKVNAPFFEKINLFILKTLQVLREYGQQMYLKNVSILLSNQ